MFDICVQMSRVLDGAYDKKMAVVELLKQYAEDRLVDRLVSALAALLETERERALVPVLR